MPNAYVGSPSGGPHTSGRQVRIAPPRRVRIAVAVALAGAALLAVARVDRPRALDAGRVVLGGAQGSVRGVDAERTAAALDPPGTVRRHGAHLYLDATMFRFLGINVPQAATDPVVSRGCGAEVDLAGLFARLPSRTVVRVGFGQDTTISASTGQRDWTALDRVVTLAAASPSQPKLIVSLTSQSGTCDSGRWKDRGWYAGGYLWPSVGTDGRARAAYVDFLDAVVSRYAASPTIAYWEPVGEPEPADCGGGATGSDCYGHKTCPPDATDVLRRFFDDVGARVRRLDPVHPIADGAIGGGQCGWGGNGNRAILASPGLDVATFHDYGRDAEAMPTELRDRIGDATALGKPIVVDEVGIDARDVARCTSRAARSEMLAAKLGASMAAGVTGFVPWDYAERLDDRCDTRITPDDPSFALVVGAAPAAAAVMTAAP